MKGKSYKIIVKDISKLESYGFVKVKREEKYNWLRYEYGYYLYSGTTDRCGRLCYCISVYDDDNKINMQTCGGYALKVLCEMFRDGIVEFVDCGDVSKRIEKKQKQIEKLEKEIAALCQRAKN